MFYSIIKYLFLSFVLINTQCVYSEEYTQEQALSSYTHYKLQQPAAESDGRVQTLNEKGAMSPVFDLATQAFIEQSADKKVLEIGGAYGKVMLEMLKKHPKTVYHINDLDERHLFIASHHLEQAYKQKEIERAALNNLRYISGNIASVAFPMNEKYDAILIARVMHFFSPEQMTIAIDNITKLLKPDGKVYVIAITPYVKRYQAFIPEYEKRLANHELYPGYVVSLAGWLNVNSTNSAQQAAISKEPFMFLDDKVLQRAFAKAGLKILKCQTTPLGYASESWALDGRENVILIAQKV